MKQAIVEGKDPNLAPCFVLLILSWGGGIILISNLILIFIENVSCALYIYIYIYISWAPSGSSGSVLKLSILMESILMEFTRIMKVTLLHHILLNIHLNGNYRKKQL